MKQHHFPYTLRAFTAVVLALLLMFSTMTTAFSAITDDLADTGADAEIADAGAEADLAETDSDNIERILFVGIPTGWGTDVSNTKIHYYTAGDSSTTTLGLTSAGVTSADGNNNMFYAVVTTTKNNWQIERGGNWYGGDQDITSNNVGYIWWNNGAQASYGTFQMASTAQLKINGQNSASVKTGESIAVTPSLTSNTTFNAMKSHSYTVLKDGASVTASTYINATTGVFSASTAGSYEITDTVTYNAKGFTSVTDTATTNTVRITVVDTPAAGFSVKKGMTFYLDDRDSLGTPKFSFATSSSGTGATSPVNGTSINGLSNIYFAEAPADGYTHVKVTNAGGTIDSGWCPITSAATNTLTYSSGQFYGLQLPWNTGSSNFTGGFGHVYFDTSSTGWTVDATNKLYFVIGRDNYQDMIEMSEVANTNGKLYFITPNSSWNDYTYFGFALSTTKKTGSYHPNAAANGVLKAASKYTTFASMYNLSGSTKSFIGIGLNSGTVSALDILWIRDSAIDGTGVYNSSLDNGAPANEGKYLNRGQKFTITGRGTVSYDGYKATAAGTSGVTAVTGSFSATDSYVYPCRSTTFSFTATPNSGYSVSSVTLDGDTLTPTNGVYSYTVTGGDDKTNTSPQNVVITFTKTGHPDVFLLGLWETGEATKTVWEANSTNNPDRVMNFASTLTIGGDTMTNVYYLDMVLTGNKTYSSSESQSVDGQTITNGFKVYDTDLNSPWLSNSGTYTSGQSWWSLIDTTNCALTTLSKAGKATYRFVYDPSHSIDGTTKPCIRVYYPQVVTFNNNESTAVSGGGATSADTTSEQIVTYGTKAKTITPVREGYSFVGWYDNAAGTGSQHDFSANVTGAVTVYAKWQVNNVQIKVHGTQNGVDINDAVTKNVNGLSGTALTAAAAPAGYVFRGWVISGEKASHIRLYTDSSCTTAYTAGTATQNVWVKTDGSDGITTENGIVTAVYVTNKTVAVTDGDGSATSIAEEYYSAISGKTTNPQNFDFGAAVTVSFENLPAGFGIDSVTFADGKAPDSYINYGHYISFTMPDHDVTVDDIVVTPFTCRITVKNANTVDVDGLSSSGYYSTGADVHTITITGSDDYYGTSVLNSLTVKYIGGSPITVDEDHTSLTTTFDGSTLTVVYDTTDHSVTITGHIGGNVIITPSCSTQYNINITSKVMSDVSSKYITYNKKSTTADKQIEAVTVADLKAYLKLDSAPANADAAEANSVAWPLVTKTHSGSTYYLLEADADGDFIAKLDEGSRLLLVTENRNTKYSFIGWFSGSSTGPELTSAVGTSEIYEYTLDQSIYLYGVITRDIYIGGDGAGGAGGLNASWSNASKMTYDEANKVYYYETGSISRNTNYYFKIFDQAATGCNNSSGTSNQAVWYNAAKLFAQNADYGVTLAGSHAIGNNSDAYFNLSSSVTNVNGNKVRVYYKPASQEVYVIPVYNTNYHEVYFSNGRIDGLQTLGLTLSTPVSQFTTPASASGTGATISGQGTTENYCYYRFTDSATIRFKTTVSGTNAGSVKVAGFVVYNMDNGEAITVPAYKSGNDYFSSKDGTSAADITVTGNTFICPVYELTDAYLTANSSTIEAYEVFVNAADVDTNVWGDLVSMYTFGGDGDARDTNGHWPGQLMLPSGKSFSGVVYQKTGNNKLSGIVFENYNSYASFFGKFGKRFNYPDWAQTYDYLEPITLMDQSSASSALLSFSLKQNKDGYRGEYYGSRSKKMGPYYLDVYNEHNNEAKPGVKYDYYDPGLDEHQSLFDNYTFEYLTDKDGKERLNLYGEAVGSASAGYYVICVGDVDYLNNTTQNGKTYTPATGYNGEYSVEWYVYDANGVFLLHTLSDSLYGREGSSETPYIVEKLLASGYISNPMSLKEKSVKISYEAPNLRDEATRFSGQWYSNSTNEKVTVFAGVGMMTDDGKAIVPENPQSTASYGTSAISYASNLAGAAKGTINGLDWASLKLSDATKGEVTLTATVPSTSTFKGWYSYDETKDAYTKVSDERVYTPKFGSESRYFAMFSAQATYYFTYYGRTGLKTYSVKAGTGATQAEMTAGGILDKTSRLSEVTSAAGAAATAIRVFNHQDISFTVTAAAMDNTNPYEISLEGTETDQSYNLVVYHYNGGTTPVQKATISGAFGTAIDVTADSRLGNGTPLTNTKPSDHQDYVFLGWYEYDGTNWGTEVLSTRANFGFAITEDMSIAPKFGTQAEKDAVTADTNWYAYIDRNEITQELTDPNTGIIYNDSMIRFRYGADSATTLPNNCEYGILVMYQTAAEYAGNSYLGNLNTKAKAEKYIKALPVGEGETYKGGRITTRNVSVVNIKGKNLSALNRVDIAQGLDYATNTGGKYVVFAYIKNGDNYTISNPWSNLQDFTVGVKTIG